MQQYCLKLTTSKIDGQQIEFGKSVSPDEVLEKAIAIIKGE